MLHIYDISSLRVNNYRNAKYKLFKMNAERKLTLLASNAMVSLKMVNEHRNMKEVAGDKYVYLIYYVHLVGINRSD